MPISCHFGYCKALLFWSVTHVSIAITSVQTFTSTLTFSISLFFFLFIYRSALLGYVSGWLTIDNAIFLHATAAKSQSWTCHIQDLQSAISLVSISPWHSYHARCLSTISRDEHYIEYLTISSPVMPDSYTSKRSGPYWSNPPFLLFLHLTLALSLECQSARMSKYLKRWVRPVPRMLS